MAKANTFIADFSHEDSHNGIVCGMDEAGRAPLVGPVTAACVYIPDNKRSLAFIDQIKDSKKVAKAKRETLYDQIKGHLCFGIAHVFENEIDQINIHHASLLAMKRAYHIMCNEFGILPSFGLVDGKFSPDLPCNSQPLVKGDSKSKSIAAASILAKVHRDRYMLALHEEYPYYGWDTNSGYPTRQHLDALEQHGITKHHRKSFSPVKQYELEVS